MEAWKAQQKKYFDHNHPTLKVVPGRTTLLGLTTDQQSDQQSDRQICTLFFAFAALVAQTLHILMWRVLRLLYFPTFL